VVMWQHNVVPTYLTTLNVTHT